MEQHPKTPRCDVAQTTPKAPYEPPRVEFVALQPEEGLLACDKITNPPCTVAAIS